MSALSTIPSDATSDAELVAAARGGCPEAFTALFARHRARVAGVVARRVPVADVDDVVQDTFVRAWSRLAGLDDPARFGPWVRTIAVRAAADHGRSSATRAGALAAPWLDDVAVDETDDLAEALDRRHRADVVTTHLRGLRSRDGRALWLRDALDAPVAEVAAELGLTEASTRVLLARARRRLRTAVGVLTGWAVAVVVAGRRPAGASPATVPVAAVLGAAVVLGVTAPAPAPPRAPAPDGSSATAVDRVDRAAHHAAVTPEPDRETAAPASGSAPAVVVRGVLVAPRDGAPSPAEPLADPRLERRLVAEDDPDRDLQVGSPDDPVLVGVHDGGVLDELPLELPDDGRLPLDGTGSPDPLSR